MASESLWQARSARDEHPFLKSDLETDVVIIGAGMTGLLTARALLRGGKRVVVLERRAVASGTTGSSTAHVTSLIDCGYAGIEKKFGRDAALQVARTTTRSIEELAALADVFDLRGCERVPAYFYAHAASETPRVNDELEAAKRAGLVVEGITEVPIPPAEHGGIMVREQLQLDPVELTAVLAADVTARGGQIFEDSRVVFIDEGEPCRVETPRGWVRAAEVVMATHTPLGFSLLQTEVAPYRSYVMAVRSEWPIGRGLYFDTGNPYHYVRGVSRNEPSLFLVGGGDHKTGAPASDSVWEALHDWSKAQLNVGPPRGRWSAQFYASADGLPYIGRTSRHGHVHVATGFGGDGIVFGVIAARAIAASILGEANSDLELFTPTRIKPVASAKKFIRENADVALHFVADRLTAADEESLDDVRRGEGRLVQLGMRKVAAYRDRTGNLHCVKPTCTHLKCIVHFNAAETSWDCPCHGGRFDVDGKPIEGPPLASLEPYELPQPVEERREKQPILMPGVQPAT